MKRTAPLWALAFLLTLAAATGALAGAVYHYLDENGVHHFTNVPGASSRYTFFSFFRDAPANDKGAILRKVEESSRRYGLDKDFVEAVIKAESNYQSGAVSGQGAQGLMQIMPDTQRMLGVSDPFDINQNIDAGVRYLRLQVDRFGDYELALAAYNAGPEQVARYNGVPPFAETREYVRKVLDIYESLRAE